MSRVQVDYRTSSRKVYNKFCIEYPDIKISYPKWREIIYSFNYALRDYILETGEKVKLWYGFGPLAISKKKSIRQATIRGKQVITLPVDWKKTKLVGKKIYHLNSHTDGYKYKWFWFIGESRFENCTIWNFKPSRSSSRKITEYLKKKDYSEVYKIWGKH